MPLQPPECTAGADQHGRPVQPACSWQRVPTRAHLTGEDLRSGGPLLVVTQAIQAHSKRLVSGLHALRLRLLPLAPGHMNGHCVCSVVVVVQATRGHVVVAVTVAAAPKTGLWRQGGASRRSACGAHGRVAIVVERAPRTVPCVVHSFEHPRQRRAGDC